MNTSRFTLKNNRFPEWMTQAIFCATAACLVFSLAGCIKESSTVTSNSSQPEITSVSPASILAGSGSFTLTVDGSNFNSSSHVQWGGFSRPTAYVGSTQLRATITSADISTGGIYQITVMNTSPSIVTSNEVDFSVNNPVPIITSINPSSVKADSGSFTLTIYGRNFFPESSVQWGDTSEPADYISSTHLSAELSSGSEIINRSLSVSNPSPGGGTSNSVSLNVTAPGLEVLTKSLPDANSAKAYAYTLKADGGITPYDWSIQSGTLPAGLNLDSGGEISGTPPAVATDTDFPFTVEISDSAAPPSYALQDLNIRVRSAGLGRNDVCGPNTATPVSNGVIRASLSPYGDRDVYSFQGTAGNSVTVEIFAQRIPLYGDPTIQDNYLDSFLEILDDGCNTIQYNDDIDLGIVYDSKISDFALPYTGTFYIRVSDLRGDGRPDFQYELQLSGAD
jgi:hypothetical protein